MKKHMKTIMKKIQTGVQWSRYCLRSLFVTFLLMLTLGVTDAWGDNTATITRRALDDSDWTNILSGGTSDAYITWKGNDAGQHVTFKLSGGTFKNATWQYFQSTGDQTHKIEWIVDEGYTVSVKNVSLVVRSSLNESTVKVGQADFVTNPYGGADDFIPVSSGTYSPALGNNSYVNILFVDGYSSANNFIKTLTVTYTIAANSFSVRFNANGGSGSMSDQSFTSGVAQGLTANAFTKSGYQFVGWNTSADGSGISYRNGESVQDLAASGIVTLYAQWAVTSTVVFDEANWRGKNGSTQNAPFTKAEDHVTFQLLDDMKKYDYDYNIWPESHKHYFFLQKEKASRLIWTVNEGYTIGVSAIYFKSANGNGYVYSSRMTRGNRKAFCQKDGEWKEKTFSLSTAAPDTIFGSTTPIALSNTEFFNINSTSSDELRIQKCSLTYFISANSYTVNYHGNATANLGGSMAQQKLTYGGTTSLNNIGFTNGYTVTYEENGGSEVADAVANSPFLGWATSAGGSKVYDNQASFAEALKTTTGVTLNLYAKWGAVPSVTLPEPEAPEYDGEGEGEYLFSGWYKGEVNDEANFIGIAGASYTPTSDITLYAKWTSKQTPRFTPDGFSNESTNAIHVGDILSLTVADVSDGLAGDFIATYDDTYFNVTREGNTISIEALNAGDGKTVVFTQTENSSIFGATVTYTFNVSKVANTMTIKDDCEKYVGQELTDVIGNINSNGTITTTSSAAGIAHYDIANDKIVVDNASAVLFGASQDVTIIINQAATYKYTAASKTIVVTVKKYANAITCSWGEWSKNVNFDSETAVTFSSNNDTGTSIVVTQTTGNLIATYDGENDEIDANFREGTARWSVSQAEDYKYQAAVTQNCTVNVGVAASPGCLVLDDATERSWSSQGNSGTYAFSIDEPGDSLYFDAERTDICVIGICEGNNTDWHIEYSTKLSPGKNDWVDLPNGAIECVAKDQYYKDFAYSIPETARAIRFITANVGSFGNKFIKNVRVTRKKWFKIEDAEGSEITELTMPSRTLVGDSTVATFKVDYSTCASTIKVASDNPHIVVNAADREFTSTTSSIKTITLKYSSTEAENITDAKVYIYTPYEHKTITVSAQTKGKLSTTLEYIGSASYAVNADNIAATSLFQVRDENDNLVENPVITLSSSATGVINTVSDNTAIDFLCGGSATITASYVGDATYAAASDLGQTITVNKLSDAISWSSVGDDGKIHVLADTDIPTSIASANTDIASYSVASANPYLSVTEEEGVYTLHAGIVGEVALTATSAGDCTYATASGSKTIAVDPREHAIIWDQDLEGIQTDDRGDITNRRITLNAYAVDNGSNPTNVPVSYAITGGGTFATIENGNELVINVAKLSGTLSTTITATTTVGTKYAIVSETKTISVVRWGTNTAKSADNENDIVDGKIVISAPHATFTFSGATAITEFGYATVMGKPEGYKLAQSLNNSGGSKTYNFSWVSTNANCSIQVNKISFWIKAYDSDAFVAKRAKVSFDGAAEESVGTAAMTANDGDFKPFSKAENYTNRNVPVVCLVTGSENFDFYIKNISIEYTVYTTAPSATSGIASVDRTINATADKKTIDVRSFFQYATPAPDDFSYSYEIVGAPEHAHLLADGYTFWADAVGDYTVRAKVNAEEDHRESEWGSTKTIHVNKVPYVFNNSEEDQKWDTENNWTIGSWPIENLPTEEDDVIVRGHLTIDEEIAVNSVTIEAGEGRIVEIAPTGGLTVGAGGITGATKDNLKLKAGDTGETKGQTGYLRISPDYTGAMPEATVEMYSIGYYNKAAAAENSAAWQLVGSPVDFGSRLAKTVYTRSWIYSYDESTDSWYNERSSLVMQPFKGYKTTQYDSNEGKLMTYTGNLYPVNKTPEDKVYDIDLEYTEGYGHNVVANSFSAPIDITQFEVSDFENAEKTIYIYNTGNRAQRIAAGGDLNGNSAGQWTAISIGTIEEMTTYFSENPGVYSTIAPMQGFCVNATGSDAKLKLDYTKLVWNADYSAHSPKPMRSPRRIASQEEPITGTMKIAVEADGWSDEVFMLESERYDEIYEDGFDAHKLMSGEMNIFIIREGEKLAIDATNSIIGTRVGVRTGEETTYTMTFSHVNSGDELTLWDIEAEEKIEISEGQTYTFFAEPNTEITERFMIVEREGAPSVTTGVDNTQSDVKASKFIKDGQLFILKNGVLYDATGARVK